MSSRRDFLRTSTIGLTSIFFPSDALLARSEENNSYFDFQKEQIPYDILLWIELIGFDNTLSDYGVKEFLSRTNFIPKAISFLLVSPDFVNTHYGMSEEWVFPPEYCSYTARTFSPERKRQDWTNYQLKGLVSELHRYDIEVYCSFFDFVYEGERKGRWSWMHPEIFETGKDGDRYSYLHPLKRLDDGILYEDFFKDKLIEVLDDYNFDGVHIADGIAHTRRPLHDVDYSDDMISQFLEQTGVELPSFLLQSCKLNKEEYKKRSKWLWENKKYEWVLFHTNRWAEFFKKITNAIHEKDKKIFINTAWTQAPFEAIYRYGIDYQKIAELGVDGFIVENVSSTVAMEPILSDEHEKFFYIAMSMLMLIKVRVKATNLLPFTTIHDTTEQYDALRHIPTVVERDIYSMANLYFYNDFGNLQRCSSGIVGCLSDSLCSHEWDWLKKKWDLAYSFSPKFNGVITLIWSDNAFENQLKDYITTRRWSTHKLLYELMYRGASINVVCAIDSIDKIQGPVLILNPHLYSENEIRKVFSYRNGPILTIGGKCKFPVTPEYEFSDVYLPDPLSCAIFQSGKQFDVKLNNEPIEVIPPNFTEVTEPYSWTESLYYRKVSTSFLSKCVSVISTCMSELKLLTEAEFIKIIILKKSTNEIVSLIGNDSYYYKTPKIETKHKIKDIVVKTTFPGIPVYFDNKQFNVKVPGKGMVILNICYEN